MRRFLRTVQDGRGLLVDLNPGTLPLLAYFSAASFKGQAAGYRPTSWPDISGNPLALNAHELNNGFPAYYNANWMPSGSGAVYLGTGVLAQEGSSFFPIGDNSSGMTMYARWRQEQPVGTVIQGVAGCPTGSGAWDLFVNQLQGGSSYGLQFAGISVSAINGPAVGVGAHTVAMVLPASGTAVMYLDGVRVASGPSGAVSMDTNNSGYATALGSGHNGLYLLQGSVSAFVVAPANHSPGMVALITAWLRANL